MVARIKIEIQRHLADNASNTEFFPCESASTVASKFLNVRCNGINYYSIRCCKKCKKIFLYNSKSTTNLRRHLDYCMRNQSTYDETKEIRCGLNGKQDSVNNSEKVQLTKRYNDLTLISMHKKINENNKMSKKFKIN